MMRIIYKFRFIIFLLSIMSLLICFGNFAGSCIPFQDPTPELFEKQMADINLWKTMMIISIIPTVISVFLLLYFRCSNKYKKR